MRDSATFVHSSFACGLSGSWRNTSRSAIPIGEVMLEVVVRVMAEEVE